MIKNIKYLRIKEKKYIDILDSALEEIKNTETKGVHREIVIYKDKQTSEYKIGILTTTNRKGKTFGEFFQLPEKISKDEMNKILNQQVTKCLKTKNATDEELKNNGIL
jgi:hypothetical protein